MKKLLLVIILMFVLVGCQSVQASERQTISVTEQEVLDLIERIGELEQELANLKNDLADGTYPIGD